MNLQGILDSYSRSSLKAKIFVLIAAMLLLYGIISSSFVSYLYTTQKSLTAKSVQGYALTMASGIGQKFKKNYFDIQNIALNKIFIVESKKEIQKYLNNIASNQSSYDLILFIDRKGKLVTSNNTDYEGTEINTAYLSSLDFSKYEWFKNSLKQNYTEEEDLALFGTYVEDAHFDEITSKALGKERYGNAFSTAVLNKAGRVVGVLSLRTNFSWVEDRVTELYNSMDAEGINKVEYYILDKDNKAIMHYNPVEDVSLEVKHDRNVLGVKDMAEAGLAGVKEIQLYSSGYLMEKKAFRANNDSYVGYTSLEYDTMPLLKWSAIVNVEEGQLTGTLSSLVNTFYVLVAFLCFTFLYLAMKLMTKESDKLVVTTEALKARSNSSVATSGNLNKVSSELSDAARLQQEAVQETMSALDEMMSMLSNTNKYVEESLISADGVNQKTHEGNRIMNRMEDSMQSIQNSNTDLEAMAKIIRTISEKTNVINEIVFNTKLLAFNASIEAARAGVHGKGFAVVAEEVGGLAQLSGEAAKEIEDLIKESQNQVTNVVADIRDRISQGDKVASEAQEKFLDISNDLSTMTQKVRDILGATAEQEAGIKKVNEAMRNIDDLTHKNLSLAHDSDSLAKSVNDEAFKLEAIMEQVRKLLNGTGGLDEYLDRLGNKNKTHALKSSTKKRRKKLYSKAS